MHPQQFVLYLPLGKAKTTRSATDVKQSPHLAETFRWNLDYYLGCWKHFSLVSKMLRLSQLALITGAVILDQGELYPYTVILLCSLSPVSLHKLHYALQ